VPTICKLKTSKVKRVNIPAGIHTQDKRKRYVKKASRRRVDPIARERQERFLSNMPTPSESKRRPERPPAIREGRLPAFAYPVTPPARRRRA
jgi:hypothetical protein